MLRFNLCGKSISRKMFYKHFKHHISLFFAGMHHSLNNYSMDYIYESKIFRWLILSNRYFYNSIVWMIKAWIIKAFHINWWWVKSFLHFFVSIFFHIDVHSNIYERMLFFILHLDSIVRMKIINIDVKDNRYWESGKYFLKM